MAPDRIKNISIKWKIVVIVVAITATLVCAQTVLFSIYDTKSYTELRRNRIRSMVEITGLNLIPALSFGDTKDISEILGAFRVDPSVRAAYVLDESGKEIGRYLRNGEAFSPPGPIGRQQEHWDDSYYSLAQGIEFGGRKVATLIFVNDLAPWKERRNATLLIVLGVTAVGLSIALCLALWLQRIVTDPINRLRERIAYVAQTGDYSVRVPKGANDEIGMLEDGFDHMLAEIESRGEQLAAQLLLLEQSNKDLDERVQQRTAELQAINKELESFSYSVSHDLRAPLRSIEGFSQILLAEYGQKLDAEGQRLLGIITADVQKMGCLIDDLLAFSRTSRQQMAASRIDMNGLTRQVFDELKSRLPERTVEFVLGELPALTGDLTMIRQVMVNLLSNALKFTTPRECAIIEVEGTIDGNRSIYRVKDNGVGFDSRFKDKLFGVFHRLHSEDEFEGTGVGLALVHRIVQRHGGEVTADSALDQGATFVVSIPNIQEEKEHELD